MAYEIEVQRMLVDIEFLLVQLHTLEHYQDRKKIADICKRYKINPLNIYDFKPKPKLRGDELE